ncbi:MAG: hypothetical protein JWN67_1237 [Actinomycetia bacterium]|nr:hypothetical protein [Actinomycetes bacterium]
MRARLAVLAGLLVAGLPAAAGAATCPDTSGITGANPSPAAVGAELDAQAAAKKVPATLLKAVAFAEGYDPAASRNWVQFKADGAPLVAADCGIGMMQVTLDARFDARQLASDWKYNVAAGAQILRDKWDDSQRANPASLGPDDESVLENWWAALYRYNGTGAAARTYADTAFLFAQDPMHEAAPYTARVRGLRRPVDVFPQFTEARQFQGRATEAVLTEADGTVVARSSTYRPTRMPADPRPPVPRVAADATSAQAAGLQLSRAVFADHAARHAVLARDDDWADSLAGAALSGDWGPVLFAGGGAAGTLAAPTQGELLRVLPAGGTVYLLGGTNAVSPAVEAAVTAAGLTPVRLAGTDRLQTGLAVARKVRELQPASTDLLVARAFVSPADALTGGAAAGRTHRPLVLVPTEGVPAAVRDAIAALGPKQAFALGGTAALSDRALADLRAGGLTVERVAGADRYATAVAVASRLWGGLRRDVLAVDLASTAGWAWTLASGSLSATLAAPQLGVAPTSVPVATSSAIRSAKGTATVPVRVVVVGSAARASTAVRNALEQAATNT